jgi:hypothetical protein
LWSRLWSLSVLTIDPLAVFGVKRRQPRYDTAAGDQTISEMMTMTETAARADDDGFMAIGPGLFANAMVTVVDLIEQANEVLDELQVAQP